MTKHVRTLTAVCLITAGALMLAASASSGTISAREIADREHRCRYGSLDGGVKYWTDRELKLTARCALERWPVSWTTVDYIAERESHWRANALNPFGYCGVFQHDADSWPTRVAKFNRQVPTMNAAPSCFNGRSNVIVTIRMMHNAGFSPWSL